MSDELTPKPFNPVSFLDEEKTVYPWHKKNKYNAQRTEVDGITFDSKAEAKRYQELKLLNKAGVIIGLALQPSFDLDVNGLNIGKCILDFFYFETATGKDVYEDVKGRDNPLSKWKRMHVEAQYGIKVVIVK